MLFIYNKAIPQSKNILHSLSILYGIDEYQSKQICREIGINPHTNINKLHTKQVNKLVDYISKNLEVENKKRLSNRDSLTNLLNIKHTRGIRFRLGLPVRGQRTHTNAKTVRKYRKIFTQKNKKIINKKFLKTKKNKR